MTDKTKKILKIVSWSLIGLGTIGAIVLGATTQEISAGVVLVDGVIIAVAEAIKFFIEKVNK